MPLKLEVRSVRKRFGKHVLALDRVDLTIEEGEFVSIIGPSGCGKSTLFNILAGLDRPTEGEILMEGCPRSPADLLGHVGYMPQRDLLMPWRTVLDNTTLPLEIQGIDRTEARRRALALFPEFGLSHFEHRWPREISGGMRQRAALLRTFLAGRDLLLLDEPFGALDSLSRAGMQQWLLSVWEAHRKTILFVTHDIDEALFLSDRVYVMSARPGKILDQVIVDSARPRSYELTTTSQHVERKERLLELLRPDARVVEQ